MELYELKQDIIETTELAALTVLKLLNPAFDDVKFSEACKISGGRRWLQHHIDRGNIKGIRRGTAKNSPIYFSRVEIAALKKAEANGDIYRKNKS